MTDQEKRIAVAEACGWSKFMMGTGVPPGHDHNWSDFVRPLPDYPNDLNAMHEAVKTLDATQYREWSVNLLNITNRPYNADASQRCEAFLRTVGKWKGE